MLKGKYLIIFGIAILLVGLSFLMSSETITEEIISKTFTKTTEQVYGKIEIKNQSDYKLKEVTLTYNTDYCLTNCYAEGTTTLYQTGKLFDNITFRKDKISNTYFEKPYTIWIGKSSTKLVDVPVYEEVCNLNINGSKSCSNVETGKTKENQTTLVYDTEYKLTDLPAGNYLWKIEGTKESQENLDWVATFNGIKATEWATWSSSFEVGLTGYWSFDEGSGTNVKERVFGINNGTMYGAGWYAGINGTAVNITTTASDSVMTTANACNFSLDKPFSLGYWINRSAYAGASDVTIMGKVNSAQKGWDIVEFRRPTGGGNYMVLFEMHDTNSNVQKESGWVNSVPTSASGKYEMYIVTYNGSGNSTQVKLYRNGTNLGLPNAAANKNGAVTSINNLDPFIIGNGTNPETASPINSKLDEVFCYNRTLTSSEASDLYNAGAGIFYPNPIIITNTCTYSGTGDWRIQIEDNCTINSNSLGANTLWVNGSNGILIVNGTTTAHQIMKTPTIKNGGYQILVNVNGELGVLK